MKRKIEVFTAGCPVCDDAVAIIERIRCDSCDVQILDLRDEDVARRAAELEIRSIPAVAVDGRLASCCTGGGVTEEALRAEGIGQPL